MVGLYVAAPPRLKFASKRAILPWNAGDVSAVPGRRR